MPETEAVAVLQGEGDVFVLVLVMEPMRSSTNLLLQVVVLLFRLQPVVAVDDADEMGFEFKSKVADVERVVRPPPTPTPPPPRV